MNSIRTQETYKLDIISRYLTTSVGSSDRSRRSNLLLQLGNLGSTFLQFLVQPLNFAIELGDKFFLLFQGRLSGLGFLD